MSVVPRYNPSGPTTLARTLLLVVGLGGLVSCRRLGDAHFKDAPSGREASGIEAPSVEDADVAKATAWNEAGGPLPSRDEALAVARRIEALAAREGIGMRAVKLHAVSAMLCERVWRVYGVDSDVVEAIDDYRAAGAHLAVPGACEAAQRGARLAGERARDASITYAEFHRIKRRLTPSTTAGAGATACIQKVEDALGRLTAFRPAQPALDAIDQELESEGALAPLSSSNGPLPAQPKHPPQIARVDYWPGPDAARVVVVLDQPAAYRTGDGGMAGERAPQTFLELDGVSLGTVPRDLSSQGILTHVRAEATSTGSRILLDLDGRAWWRVFHVGDPYRIVIDVARHPPGLRSPRTVSRVVIDPGHGGKDTGAVGPAGVAEKNVTLDVALRVARILNVQGIQVLLTRDDDRFVPLEERTARANAFAADLFVSLHCNASEGGNRRGVETYVLDTTRDAIAARVAARENEMTPDASAELAAMLGGMRLADQANRSAHFGSLLQRSTTTALQMRYGEVIDGGLHTAGFYVLVGARMPSVLFESGYISNAVEERQLASAEHRQLLADAVANAVKAYREGR